MKAKKIQYLITFLLILWLVLPCQSQYKILEDQKAVELVLQAIDSIYNLNFDAADTIITDLEKKLGDYPGVLLLKAFYVNWKYKPIKEEHESFTLFESYLIKGIEKCEEMIQEDKEDVEASFFLMACHAFLAELYVNNGSNFKALGEAKSAYKYIKIGFEHTSENPEFYFSSGIYNYYREKYPEENPFYKSFLWFFRNGDMDQGLSQLQKGTEQAIFTRAECITYLFHINLRYEDKPQEAIYYATILKDKYPQNLYYISNYLENKIRLNQYDNILPLIHKLMNNEKVFYQYLGEIYYGKYLENHNHLISDAIKHYKIADNLGDKDEVRTPHYDSILFLGLGKTNLEKGNTDLGKQYLKRSVKAAEYSAYRKDAEAILNK